MLCASFTAAGLKALHVGAEPESVHVPVEPALHVHELCASHARAYRVSVPATARVSWRVTLVAPEIGEVHAASEYHWYEKVVPPGSVAFAVNVMGEPAVVGPLFVAVTDGGTLIHVELFTSAQFEFAEPSYARYE
jgi:hypothetical protein